MAYTPWKDIQFSLVNKYGCITLLSSVPAGNILSLRSSGVHRSKAIGKSLGFDLDGYGRVKFFKGQEHDELASDHQVISHSDLNGVQFNLWINTDVEQLVITCCGHNLLLIEKRGVYRFAAVPGEILGMPVDDLGRLLVLR